MIAKVAPIRRMPKKISELDYLIPDELEGKVELGSLVMIPFRNLSIFGIVTKLNSEKSEIKGKLKSIESLVWETPAFTTHQLNFLREVSDFYSTPLGFVLQSSLPALKKTKIKKVTLNTSQAKEGISRKKPQLKLYTNSVQRKELFEALISEGQTLIIVPEVRAIANTLSLLPTGAVAISSELTEKELFDIWVKIRTGEIKTVVGTRRALFMPWCDLRTVVVDDESNPNHKSWDMAPRIHARETALMLAHAHGAQCILTGHTPSVESWYFAGAGVYQNEQQLSPLHTNTDITDMRDERRGRNYSFMSLELDDAIKETNGGDIFLFINRKGSSAYVGCRDCGFIAKCQKCSRGLVYHENTATLECHFCKINSKMFLSCPNCHGTNVAMYGTGTQLAENDLKKSYPNKKIIRIDSDTVDIYNHTAESKIIIGTQIAWDKIDWTKLKLMAFLDADSSLFIPEYKMTENLWWQLRDAQYKLPKDGRLIIQTSHTEHRVISTLYDPAKYYEEELNERKQFAYPPFNYVVRLYNGEKNQVLAKQTADNMHVSLKSLTKDRTDIIISDPLPFSPIYFNGQYWYSIVVKAKFDKYKQITKLLAENLPENWKFDPNPNNLLSF